MVDFKFYLGRQGVRGQRGEKGEIGFSPLISEKTNTATEYVLHIQNETDETSFDTVNLKEGLIPEDLGGTIVRYNRETGTQYYGEIDTATETVSGVVKLEPEETILTPTSETSVLTAQNAVENYVSKEGDNILKGTNSFIKGITTKSITGNDTDGFTIVENGEIKISLTKNYVNIGRNTLPLILNGSTITKNGLTDAFLTTADVDGETIKVQDGKLHVIGGGGGTVDTEAREAIANLQVDVNANSSDILTLKNSVATKQTKLTAGDNITLTDLSDGTVKISSTGGGISDIPVASATTLGGIKVGTNLSIDENGVLSASGKLSVDVIDGGDSTTVNPLVTLANSSGNVIAQYNGETTGGEYNDIA